MENTPDTAPQDGADPGPDPLDAIVAKAEGLEGPSTDQAAAEQPQGPSLAELQAELLQHLQTARFMVTPVFSWWPEFGLIWSDTTLKGIAANGAIVMQRHGWTLGEVLTKYGPYIGLAASLVPAVLATVAAVKVRQQQLRAQQAQGLQPVQPAQEADA